jgi:cell division protease FtsH
MSTDVGPVRVVQNDAESFLGRDLLTDSSVSARTLETIDASVRSLVIEAQAAAAAILKRHRSVLDDVADALIDQESLDAAELAELLVFRPPTRVGGRKAAAAATRAASTSPS